MTIIYTKYDENSTAEGLQASDYNIVGGNGTVQGEIHEIHVEKREVCTIQGKNVFCKRNKFQKEH